MNGARLAPGVFVLLWSTGYIGVRYGLPAAPPFAFLAVRLIVAAAVMAVVAAVAGAPPVADRAAARDAVIGGLLLHGGLLGGTFYALAHGVSAGVAAVVIGLQPVLVAVLASRVLGERLTSGQWIGLALGLVGVVLVLLPGLRAGVGVTGRGLLACVVALVSGAVGTLWQKERGAAMPLLWGTALQYGVTASVVGVLALSTEHRAVVWNARLLAAVAWLVVVLSVGAILLLYKLLRRGSTARVTALFYLVPPATAVQGHVLFGERLTLLSVAGFAVVAIGVALVVRPTACPAPVVHVR